MGVLSPSPLSVQPISEPLYAHELREALLRIPQDARVSAHQSFVPHLSHRRYIYEFPNPFMCSYWGVRCENMHDAAAVEYVVLRKDAMSEEWTTMINSIRNEFAAAYETDAVLLLQRPEAEPQQVPEHG